MKQNILVKTAIILALLAGCGSKVAVETNNDVSKDVVTKIGAAITESYRGYNNDGPQLKHYRVGDRQYRLEATNFPEDKVYALIQHTMSEGLTTLDEYSVNRYGELVNETDQLLAMRDIEATNLVKGEAMDMVLVSNDEEICVATHIVPKPIVTKSEGGGKIAVEILTPDAYEFHLKGEGFKPHEILKCKFESSTSNNVEKRSIMATEEGTIDMIFAPIRNAAESGRGQVTLLNEDGGNEVSFVYNWGMMAFNDDMTNNNENVATMEDNNEKTVF